MRRILSFALWFGLVASPSSHPVAQETTTEEKLLEIARLRLGISDAAGLKPYIVDRGDVWWVTYISQTATHTGGLPIIEIDKQTNEVRKVVRTQ